MVLSLALAPRAARAQIGGCTPDLSDAFVLEVETSLGTIPIELYPNLAPITVRNFVRYAATRAWDHALIHRSVPGFVIQGGGHREQSGSYAAISTFGTIQNEPCLSNTLGSVAMARVGGQVNSATSQWFVNLANNTGLDGVDQGFTAFGRVVGNGMNVVNAIAAVPVFNAAIYFTLPINSIFRSLPLQTLPTDPPGGYGCSRGSPLFGLVNTALTAFVADPARNASGAPIPILLDPQCTGGGSPPPPSTSCTTGVGRDVNGFVFNSSFQLVPVGGFVHMSCPAISESEISWAARRAGTIPQFFPNDVEIIAVPEPDAGALGATGALGLALLRALRARKLRSSASKLRAN